MAPPPLGAARAAFRAFGGTVVVHTAVADRLDAATAAARAEIEAMDDACDRTRPDSELSRINACAGRLVPVSAHFGEAIDVAIRAARLTDGALDPARGLGWRSIEWDPRQRAVRIGPGAHLDLDATARALTADRAAYAACRAAECGVLVALDDYLAAQGQAPDGGWRVSLTEHHGNGDDATGRFPDAAETVTLTEGGLATSTGALSSGRAEPRQHPAWRTITVAAITCVDASIAATTALIRGASAARWLSDLGLPARLVRQDGSVLTLSGWPARRATTDPRNSAEG